MHDLMDEIFQAEHELFEVRPLFQWPRGWETRCIQQHLAKLRHQWRTNFVA